MRCCNHIPTVRMFSPRYNSIQRPGWDLEGSASKLLTCIHCKDWSVSLSCDGQITWFMARGKAEKQPFQINLSLRQHLFSVQRYSSNTGQVQNMSTLLEVTVYLPSLFAFLFVTGAHSPPLIISYWPISCLPYYPLSLCGFLFVMITFHVYKLFMEVNCRAIFFSQFPLMKISLLFSWRVYVLSQDAPHVMTLVIHITPVTSLKTVSTTMLLDSGATGLFINRAHPLPQYVPGGKHVWGQS